MPTIHVSPPSPKKTTHTHKKTTEIDNLIKPTEYNKNMTFSNVDDNGQLQQNGRSLQKNFIEILHF